MLSNGKKSRLRPEMYLLFVPELVSIGLMEVFLCDYPGMFMENTTRGHIRETGCKQLPDVKRQKHMEITTLSLNH